MRKKKKRTKKAGSKKLSKEKEAMRQVSTVLSEGNDFERRVLALDLGAKTGWASWSKEGLCSGVWKLPNDRGRPGQRWVSLYTLVRSEQPSMIVYESAGMWRGVWAARCYAGYLTAIEMAAELARVRIVGFPAGSLKKWATGSGRASKQDMFETAMVLWPDVEEIVDDNHADALCLLGWAVRGLSDGYL